MKYVFVKNDDPTFKMEMMTDRDGQITNIKNVNHLETDLDIGEYFPYSLAINYANVNGYSLKVYGKPENMMREYVRYLIKSEFQHEISENKLNESPDGIKYDGVFTHFLFPDAYPFGYYNFEDIRPLIKPFKDMAMTGYRSDTPEDKAYLEALSEFKKRIPEIQSGSLTPEYELYVGNNKSTHDKIEIYIDTNLKYSLMWNDLRPRSYMKYAGRIWTKNKVISFWNIPSKSDFPKVISDLEKDLRINIDNTWKLDTGKQKVVNLFDYMQGKLNNSDPTWSDSNKPHQMSPVEKEKMKRNVNGYGSEKQQRISHKAGFKTPAEFNAYGKTSESVIRLKEKEGIHNHPKVKELIQTAKDLDKQGKDLFVVSFYDVTNETVCKVCDKTELLKLGGKYGHNDFKVHYMPKKFMDHYRKMEERKKHVIKNKIISNDKKIFESPDHIDYDGENIEFGDPDSMAFGYYNKKINDELLKKAKSIKEKNSQIFYDKLGPFIEIFNKYLSTPVITPDDKMYVSNFSDAHSHIIDDISSGSTSLLRYNLYSRDRFKFAGRIWLNSKIISFWDFPPKNLIKKVLYDLGKVINKEIDDTWRIDTHNELINVNDYEQPSSNDLNRGSEHVKSPVEKSSRDINGHGSQKYQNTAHKAGFKTPAEFNTARSTSESVNESETEPILYMTIAISGMGKSTFINKHFNKNVVVCPDEIRKETTGDISNHENEGNIWNLVDQRINLNLKKYGKAVLDATNVDSNYRQLFLDKFPNTKKVAIVFPSDPRIAKSRIKKDLESGKDRSVVPDEVIDQQFQSFQSGQKDIKTQFDKVIYV